MSESVKDNDTVASTRKGRILASHLIDKLNAYVEENFKDENELDGLIVAYGIDVFFSDCLFSTADMFRGEDESVDEFIQQRMAALTEFMRCKAKELKLK